MEDARNMIHYCRITPDNNMATGGGPVGLASGANMDVDSSESARRCWKSTPASCSPC